MTKKSTQILNLTWKRERACLAPTSFSIPLTLRSTWMMIRWCMYAYICIYDIIWYDAVKDDVCIWYHIIWYYIYVLLHPIHAKVNLKKSMITAVCSKPDLQTAFNQNYHLSILDFLGCSQLDQKYQFFQFLGLCWVMGNPTLPPWKQSKATQQLLLLAQLSFSV